MAETIGYSALNLDEDCFEYNEDACWVAESPQTLGPFVADGWAPHAPHETTAVSLQDLLDDFGGSSGEYAFDPGAFARFKEQAEAAGVSYQAEKQSEDDGRFYLVTKLGR